MISVAAPVRRRQPLVVVATLLCAALLAALWWPDGLVVALTGFAVASGLHTISHTIEAWPTSWSCGPRTSRPGRRARPVPRPRRSGSRRPPPGRARPPRSRAS
jgi:hypothetical protein